MEPEADGLKCTNVASDDAVLGQLIQLQVIEGLPRANDSNVCKTNDGERRLFRPLRIIETDMKCNLKAEVSSPVPKPSIPGISSPKLQGGKKQLHNLQLSLNL